MSNGEGLKVLVVDDEQFILDSLTGFLEDYEFEVTCADSAESALQILEAERFDLAVVDLRLPGISGEALIQKAYKNHQHIRFVIHTGSVGYLLSEDLKKIGITNDHVFFKPVPDLTDLVNVLLGFVQRAPVKKP